MTVSKHLTTNQVEDAIKALDPTLPFATEIKVVLERAWVQALEDEDYWVEAGKPHLRTFLKTTPLGLAIVDLATSILFTYDGSNDDKEN